MLHVTNGDSTATLLRRTGVTGTVIAWRDILHDGPVPAGLALEAMSDVRARFLASTGAGSLQSILRLFGARDAALRAARQVVLWFEHDLYDQLQLIQILATLATQRETTAGLICIDTFPGVDSFHGLGDLTPAQLASLWPGRQRVARAHLAVGARAWTAFSSPDPLALRHLLATDISALPFLQAALERFMEEFPSPPDGLSRTERQILGAVTAGHTTFDAVYRANQKQEAAPFLGDTIIQRRIEALTNARIPLLTREPITLTAAGQRVLAGEADARQLNGLDLWLGGVRLKA
ncbi:MAG: DUF1835 domain-containing protein [Opitutaceae bacterium]